MFKEHYVQRTLKQLIPGEYNAQDGKYSRVADSTHSVLSELNFATHKKGERLGNYIM